MGKTKERIMHEKCSACNGEGKSNGSIVVKEEKDGQETPIHIYLICNECHGAGWVEI